MSIDTREVPGWTEVARPAGLHRRFEFPTYAETRAFLERLADLSKETGLYPDLSFARTYVNVTVPGPLEEGIGSEAREYAARADELGADRLGLAGVG